MNLFKKLGFMKSDERGFYIVNNAAKFSWIFYTLALFSYMVVEMIKNGELTFVFTIFCAGQFVFWSTYIYYTIKTGGRYKK